MPGRANEFLKLHNHREVRRILEAFAEGADLSWFDKASITVSKKWLGLAQHHLRVARLLASPSRNWRSVISRCYYAVYTSSRAIRYFVDGSVKPDAEDHKRVGDLPRDFPNQSAWSNFANELRRDRNLADYEPWGHVRRSLTYEPADALEKAAQFVRESRNYLRRRGVL